MGVVKRTPDDVEDLPKYLYPAGVSVSGQLFGLHSARLHKRILLVVEGAADVMAVTKALTSANAPRRLKKIVPVGAYGAGLHARQVELINSIKTPLVLLGFDNDKAGKRASSLPYNLNAPSRQVEWPAGCNDPGDATEDQVFASLKEGMKN